MSQKRPGKFERSQVASELEKLPARLKPMTRMGLVKL